jgi:3-oxoacyl-[acyl-carrier protein] reductase
VPSSADPTEARQQVMPSPIPCYPDLAGMVVLVTGGAGGLGAPLCRALVAQGARVGVVGRHPAAVFRLSSELGPAALAITADCTVPSQVEAMRAELVTGLGPPDAVVCLAGGAVIEAAPTHLLTPKQWDAVISNNLTGTFLTIASMLPLMLERGRGTIVTVASAAARIPTAMSSAPYAASKAGVIALTKQVAREVAPHGIRVNCVSPSVIATETNVPVGERLEHLTRLHPLGRLGAPEDVTSAVLFLLSAASGWITGVALDVAGGRTAD